MSGVAGGARIKRSQVLATVNDFKKKILAGYKYFDKNSEVVISGSFMSDMSKQDFGDIDLIVNFNSSLPKGDLKKDFIAYLLASHKDDIRPFTSERYAGKYYSNTGELVSILYPIAGSSENVQIDVIFSLDAKELNFKKEFLNLPAEKQGLILGLAKAAMLDESKHQNIFSVIGIPYVKLTDLNQEYDITLSSVALTIDKITYEDRVSYKVAGKENLAKITDWNKIVDIIHNVIEDAINMSFEDLLAKIKEKDWKGDRALKRIAGTFKSMISIKSGEVGTPKGDRKAETLAKVAALVEESMFDRYVRTVMTEGFTTFIKKSSDVPKDSDKDMKNIISFLLSLPLVKEFKGEHGPLTIDPIVTAKAKEIKINRELWGEPLLKEIEERKGTYKIEENLKKINKQLWITTTNGKVFTLRAGNGTLPGKVNKGLDSELKLKKVAHAMIKGKLSPNSEEYEMMVEFLNIIGRKQSDIKSYIHAGTTNTQRGTYWDGTSLQLLQNTPEKIADAIIEFKKPGNDGETKYYLSQKLKKNYFLLNGGVTPIFDPYLPARRGDTELRINPKQDINGFIKYLGLNPAKLSGLYSEDSYGSARMLKRASEDINKMTSTLLKLTKLAWSSGYWHLHINEDGSNDIFPVTKEFNGSISRINVKNWEYPGKRKEIHIAYTFRAGGKTYPAELRLRNKDAKFIPATLNINIIGQAV